MYTVPIDNKETILVPYGFYYVGGNLDTGIVISDRKEDNNKYAGKNEDGSIKNVGTDLVGNQFVWIPCELSNYSKTSWGNTYQSSNWDTTISDTEIKQIQKYSGFYVARYEAGLDINKAHTSNLSSTSNYHDNETAKPQSKAGLIPWNFVSWNTSKARAQEMYNTISVSSGLITGTQWDVMINTIASKTGASLTNPDWGNYYNIPITYTGGAANTYFQTGVFTGTGGTKNESERKLLYTGSSVQCMKYNLYDVAGNVWEWTEEVAFRSGNTDTGYRISRGGDNYNMSNKYPVCYRLGDYSVTGTDQDIGFRVVLYIW